MSRTAQKEPPPLPVLELVTPAPRRKQRPMRTGYVALQEPQPRKRRSTGLVRTLAAVATLVGVGFWYAGRHDLSDASAAQVVSAFRA